MQSLSEKKHKALIAALQQLSEWSGSKGTRQESRASDCTNRPLSSGGEGWGEEDIRELEELFARYQELLSDLGDCIDAYQDLYKDIKTNVLAPQFRHIRQQMDKKSVEYHVLKKHLYAVRSY